MFLPPGHGQPTFSGSVIPQMEGGAFLPRSLSSFEITRNVFAGSLPLARQFVTCWALRPVR